MARCDPIRCIVIALVAMAGIAAMREAFDARVGDRPRRQKSAAEEPLAIEHVRALQPGRGRDATTPWEIPWAGWKDILRRTWQQVQEDRLMATAAGVVFFALLALFPSVTALVSIYGLFARVDDIADHLSFVASVMPGGSFDIVKDQIERITSKSDNTLGVAFGLGLAGALWSANAGTKAVIDALNVVYEEPERRGFFQLNLVSLAFTLGAICAFVCAVAAVVVLPIVLSFTGLGSIEEDLARIARWPFLFIAMLLGLALLYRFGPSRHPARWQWLSVGAVLAALVWIGGSLLLSAYLADYADYDGTYGSLAGIIAAMMWLWLTAAAVLLGAELNAEIEHQTARDSTTGAEKPLGTRGAAMADTVGAAES